MFKPPLPGRVSPPFTCISIEKTSLAREFKHPRQYVLYLTVSAYLTVSGFLPQLKMAIKFPVKKVGLEKKKSGFCFSNLPHKILQQEQKYRFAKLG